DGNLDTYVSFESPAGSGVFKGQLLKESPLTGVVTCYPASVLPFASASNETAGVLITSTNDIEVLFTNGSTYKANTTGPGVYTGGITLINASSIPYQLRGDLASCSGTINGPLPVTFVGFCATEVDCKVNYHWGVELELNVARYELQLLNNAGAFNTVAQVTATNSPLKHSYSLLVPINGKTMTARLKQIDFDGRFTFSNTVVLRTVCEKTKTCTIVNNAAITNMVQVKWNNFRTTENVAVAVYNAYGAQVSKQNVVVTAFTDITSIPLNNLASGTYFLTALSASGEKYTASFIKK
ncbi:MAG: T9SS type A sorting domain-containing protein, partial [Ferruginibacter sp.]|nr:T9SS type A sorting domain-containing protein [Ferruginibacter sp.]